VIVVAVIGAAAWITVLALFLVWLVGAILS
jgi:hypothetical protein